jgi:hypothetical protein
MVEIGAGLYDSPGKKIAFGYTFGYTPRKGASRNDLFDVVWTANEKGLIAIAGYLIHRVTANLARLQVI